MSTIHQFFKKKSNSEPPKYSTIGNWMNYDISVMEYNRGNKNIMLLNF